MKKIYVILIALSIIFTSIAETWAYDDRDSHPRITERAITILFPEINQILNEKLGFSSGSQSLISGKPIIKLLREGSTAEDSPNCRAANHFHNPLLPWGQSYMTDQPGSLTVICGEWFPFYSNITWATEYLSPPPGGQKAAISSAHKKYTWSTANIYYYLALTSPFIGFREEYFSKTFESLGHVLHLLQDVSVPAHVRNDFASHLIPTGASSLNYQKWYYQPFEKYIEVNPALIANANPTPDGDFPMFNNQRISDFWDTDIYNGSNPSSSNMIGLAEFTNANYFSDYTIPTNNPTPEHSFPYPHISGSNTSGPSYQICVDYAHDSLEKRKYISRKDKGACPQPSTSRTVDHFATASLINAEYLITNENIPSLQLWLDNNVHNTYAKDLLPRAVGYSAGLLDYFFRGNIEITLPQAAIYAFTGSRDAGFTRISLNAKNTTGNSEEMTDGSIELVVRYRTVQEDPFQPFDLQASKDYVYIVVSEANSRRSIPRNSSVELVFDRGTTSIIPTNAVDISLQIVYHGRLGNEDGAVAVGMKSISDPTPVELMNNMDKVCLNGAWYSAGSPEAVTQVDANHNGIPEWDIYPHNLRDAYVKISTVGKPIAASASQYTYMVGNIGPGYISRAFILAGRDGGLIHSHAITVEKTTTADTFTHASNIFDGSWSGQALASQVEYSENRDVCNSYGFGVPCAIRHAPPFYQFRGAYMWGSTGAVFDNPEYPVGQKCQWEELQ